MVVDPDASQAPLGILVVLLGQRPHRGALDRIEQLPAAHPEAAHLAAVHPLQSRGDRRVALSQGEERDVAQPAQDVRLREPHAGLHGRLVAGPARPRRQDAHVVVRRHHRVAAVHLGVVERRLVDAALEVVGHQQARRGSEEPEHPHVGLDPIRQRLRPARLRVGQARGPQHGDEDLCHPHLAGERVGDRHALAGVIDERLLPGHVLLTHRRRQPPLELAEQLAEPAVGVAAGVDRPVLVPEDLQVDAGTLEFARHRRPVRLGVVARARAHAGVDEQARHQALVGDVRGQRPSDPRRGRTGEILAHRAWRDAELAPDRPRARPGPEVQRQQQPYPPHGKPLCRHPAPPSIAMATLEAGSSMTRETIHSLRKPPNQRGRLRQNGGRLEIRTLGAITSEPWAASDRKRWAACVGIRRLRSDTSPSTTIRP